MSTAVTVIAILLAFYAAMITLLAAAYTLGKLLRHLSRHRLRGLTDREIEITQRPYADITLWPDRAPRNGSVHKSD